MKVVTDREAWLVTGSQALHGDDALRTIRDHAVAIAHGLDDADPIPVRGIPKPVVAPSDAIREVLHAATAAAECVAVVARMHTFPPSRMWIPGLQACHQLALGP